MCLQIVVSDARAAAVEENRLVSDVRLAQSVLADAQQREVIAAAQTQASEERATSAEVRRTRFDVVCTFNFPLNVFWPRQKAVRLAAAAVAAAQTAQDRVEAGGSPVVVASTIDRQEAAQVCLFPRLSASLY